MNFFCGHLFVKGWNMRIKLKQNHVCFQIQWQTQKSFSISCWNYDWASCGLNECDRVTFLKKRHCLLLHKHFFFPFCIFWIKNYFIIDKKSAKSTVVCFYWIGSETTGQNRLFILSLESYIVHDEHRQYLIGENKGNPVNISECEEGKLPNSTSTRVPFEQNVHQVQRATRRGCLCKCV